MGIDTSGGVISGVEAAADVTRVNGAHGGGGESMDALEDPVDL
jgi:hypothetical protein